MRTVRAVLQFLYDFVIGDDWKIAAAVITSLAVTVALLLQTGMEDGAVVLAGCALLLVTFGVSMVVDVRRLRG